MLVTNHGNGKELFVIDGVRVFLNKGDNIVDDKMFKKLEKEEHFKTRVKTEKTPSGIFSLNGGGVKADKNAKKAEDLLKEAEDDALEIMQKAEDKAKKLEEEAGDRAKKLEEDAQTKADKILSDAEAKATKVVSEAEAKAKKLTQA